MIKRFLKPKIVPPDDQCAGDTRALRRLPASAQTRMDEAGERRLTM
jgi:hypothetical protein